MAMKKLMQIFNLERIIYTSAFIVLLIVIAFLIKGVCNYKEKAERYHEDLTEMREIAKQNAIENVMLESELNQNQELLEISEQENEDLNYAIGRAKRHIKRQEVNFDNSSYKSKVETLEKVEDELKYYGL